MPSFWYRIKTIFPDNGFIGPVKSIASDKVASSGNFTAPGFSTLPKISTVINFGERPIKIDFGIVSVAGKVSAGINILSPSNNLTSLVGSLSFRKEVKSITALFFPPPFPIGISLIISIREKSLLEVIPPALLIALDIEV